MLLMLITPLMYSRRTVATMKYFGCTCRCPVAEASLRVR